MTETFPVGLPEKCRTCPKIQPSLQAWRIYSISADGSRLLLETMESMGLHDDSQFQEIGRVVLESEYETDAYQQRIADQTLECIFEEPSYS